MKPEQLEQLFIGSILRKPQNIGLAGSIVLSTPAAIAVLDAMLNLSVKHKPINVQTVAIAAGVKKFAGWVSAAEDIGAGANTAFLAQEINSRNTRARIINKLESLAKVINTAPLDTIIENIRCIYNTETIGSDESGDISEALAEFEAQSKKYQEQGNIGISTGFTRWDNEYITYEPGHLWAMGGFTSVGKTATALELIARAGKNNGIAVFSMEMTKPQIISRMLSRATGFSSRLILAGKINNTSLNNAKRHLEAQPLFIFRKLRKWHEIANACRSLKMQGRISMAVWDYQQNIGAEGRSNHEKMEYISRSSQDLVQDLEICGVMLSQISLQQKRDDSGSPEFKGGGGLAECADVALHLSRPKTSQTELLVEMRKNRHGAKINLLLEYQDHYTRLEEIG